MNLRDLFTRQNENPASDGFNFFGPREPVPKAPAAESKLGQLAAGIYNGAVAPTLDFMASPEGLATSAIPGLPAVAQRGIAGLFAPVAFRNMEEARQRANEVAADPNASLQDRVTPIADAVSQGLMGIGAARHAIPKLNLGRLDVTAWHGTPHEVDRFSMDKIGTGEGAQSYGHGLYFAENPAVAEQYAKTLSGDTYRLRYKDGSGFFGSPYMTEAEATRDLSEVFPNRTDLEIAKVNEAAAPNVYKVDLAPNHEDFLHGDLPLSQQGEGVRKLLSGIMPSLEEAQRIDAEGERIASLAMREADTNPDWLNSEAQKAFEAHMASPQAQLAKLVLKQSRKGYFGDEKGDLTKGFDLYHAMPGTPAEKSAALLRMGIPGLAYLDQGSRTSGQGTHNYVMFDDKGIKILEKNGQPVAPPQSDLASVVSGVSAKHIDPATELHSAKTDFAKMAQEEYDAWQQDEDGMDEMLGGGGICDQIANRFGEHLSQKGYDIIDGGMEGDDHAFIIAAKNGRAFAIDIPPSVYETGGGYSWKKRPGVTFGGNHVSIQEIPYEDAFGQE